MIETLRANTHLVALIDACNQTVVDTLASSGMHEARIALESFSSGGKRLRPALMLLTSTIPRNLPIDQIDPSLVDLASAIELIHLATLFHDDVIDEVHMRRNSPSARAKYGSHASVLAGDYSLAEGLNLVQKSRLMNVMPEFLRTIRVLIRGESRETQHKFDFTMSNAAYYEIISEKSASLFALSCKAGALSQQYEFADTLGHFGWNLGMAFQMIDDLDDMLSLFGDSSECDLKNGYFALPFIQALGSLEDGHRDRLTGIVRDADFTLENEKFIAHLCNDLGTIRQAHSEILDHLHHAVGILDRFDRSEAVDLLGCILTDLEQYSTSQVENYQTFSLPGA
jgi:octaprenyl-diphosphate synthase